MVSAGKGVTIGILIFILIVIAVYVVLMFEFYKQQKFIFAPYTPPTPPQYYFYPQGTITALTQEQIEQRNAIIQASTGIAS